MGSDPAGVLIERVGELAARLRRGGCPVGTGQVLSAHRALAVVDPSSRAQARDALRATLCSSPEDLRCFARAFEEVFDRPTATTEERTSALERSGSHPAGGGEDGDRDGIGESELVGAWSAAATLRAKDFAALDDEERAQVRLAIARLARRSPTRRTLRTRPSRRDRGPVDVRRTAAGLLREEIERPRLRRRMVATGPRPLVLVCDASRSMAAYSRPLLQLAQAGVAAQRRIEAFVFATRLTRVTRELGGREPEAALARALEAVQDWDSGTRIGESLASLTREHSGRLGRGAVVVVFSDGWDRGDPDRLRREMERLARCAHRVIWVNPHAAEPGFEPLTRGMLAALDSVDHLRAGSSLADLEELVELLEEIA